MPKIRTFTGREIDVRNPRPEDIDLADIARGLSRQCRFAGHIDAEHYSVAEHSVFVAILLRDAGEDGAIQQIGLLHDAAEAYLGDLIGPVKAALREMAPASQVVSDFDLLELRWLRAIGERFGLGGLLAGLLPEVKRADRWALMIEDRDLRGIAPAEDVPPFVLTHHKVSWDPAVAEHFFLATCERLGVR